MRIDWPWAVTGISTDSESTPLSDLAHPTPLASSAALAILFLSAHPILGAEPLTLEPGQSPDMRSHLLGNPGDFRGALELAGIDLSLHYTAEVQGNPRGGVSSGTVFQGLVHGRLEIDFERVAGWSATRFHVHGYNIHGESLTQNHLGDLNAASNIDAPDQTRLVELWFEKGWRDDQFNLRLGQIAVDTEFALSEPGALFVNSAFGALPTMGLNVPSAIYPQGTPGARLRLEPAPFAYVQAAVYQGVPGDPADDGEGTRWRWNRAEGTLAVAEVGLTRNPETLPSTFRLGFFHHSGQFTDQVTGGTRRGQQGIYAVAQQRVFQDSGEDGPALDLFGRVSGVVKRDRSTVDLHFDAGANWKGPWASRPNDNLGLGFAYTKMGEGFRQAATTVPRPDYEGIVELSYQARPRDWLTIQPDLQYILHPGGSAAVKDAWVLGLRIDVEF